MPITIDTLQNSILHARRQEEHHKNNMHAAAGAAQAYEFLLSELIKDQRQEKQDLIDKTEELEKSSGKSRKK